MRRTDPHDRRRKAQWWGEVAEHIAMVFLICKGYRILARRVRFPVGEIDLIARSAGSYVFVEVKARRDLRAAMEAVTPASQRRIARAAALWIAKRKESPDSMQRFDVLVIRPWRFPHHIRNAWWTEYDH